jgi:hypothetical protein
MFGTTRLKWINKRFQKRERYGMAILWPLKNPDPGANGCCGDRWREKIKRQTPPFALLQTPLMKRLQQCHAPSMVPLATVYLHGSHVAIAQVDIAGKIK